MGKKGKSRRRGFGTQGIMKLLRLGSLVAPAAYHALRAGTPEYKARNILLRYTGYDMQDGTFRPQYLAEGWGPFIVTNLVTHGVPKLTGLIRRI